MIFSEEHLEEIRLRWETVRDIAVEINGGPDGRAQLPAGRGASQVELRVTREADPAVAGDVLFVGYVFSAIPRLLEALASGHALSAADALVTGTRIASASPGPWTAFIESDGGTGGSDVIRVSDDDSEPDMYLWMGLHPAPSSVYRFVAEARQDLPALLAAARR